MCVVSMVMDYWKDDFNRKYPSGIIPTSINPFPFAVSREEFEEIKKELQELKKLILAAKKYDEATNQPDCEQDSKIELVKKIAELVGVDMNEVFKK